MLQHLPCKRVQVDAVSLDQGRHDAGPSCLSGQESPLGKADFPYSHRTVLLSALPQLEAVNKNEGAMQEIPRDQILPRIALENAWWEPPYEVPSRYTKWPPRPYIKLFYPLFRNLDVVRAPVLMGPRRVGKTYLLHHCVENLLRDGITPRRICYISVDTPTYLNQSLESFLGLYQEAAGISLTDTAEPAFIIFDEIQYMPQWERHLKTLVDTYPHLRFVVSGSAAAALRLKSQESGAGRFTDFLLPPLTFYEYLELLRKSDLVRAHTFGDAGVYSPQDLAQLNKSFIDYISFGGYPEAALSKEIQSAPERFIKSDIIEKVLLRDIPQLYGIGNVQELNSLFTSLAFNTAQECSLEQISKKSGVTSPTIKRYIEYLEAAFLVHVLYRVDQTGKRFQRQRNFKIYLTNPSLRTALFGPVDPGKSEFGHLVETAVFAQWFHGEQSLHYARWHKGEIDLVNLSQGSRWAVEVKWSDKPVKNLSSLKQPLDFCKKNDIASLSITTRTKTAQRRVGEVNLYYWPASLYSFAVGHSVINYRVRNLEMPPTSST